MFDVKDLVYAGVLLYTVYWSCEKCELFERHVHSLQEVVDKLNNENERLIYTITAKVHDFNRTVTILKIQFDQLRDHFHEYVMDTTRLYKEHLEKERYLTECIKTAKKELKTEYELNRAKLFEELYKAKLELVSETFSKGVTPKNCFICIHRCVSSPETTMKLTNNKKLSQTFEAVNKRFSALQSFVYSSLEGISFEKRQVLSTRAFLNSMWIKLDGIVQKTYKENKHGRESLDYIDTETIKQLKTCSKSKSFTEKSIANTFDDNDNGEQVNFEQNVNDQPASDVEERLPQRRTPPQSGVQILLRCISYGVLLLGILLVGKRYFPLHINREWIKKKRSVKTFEGNNNQVSISKDKLENSLCVIGFDGGLAQKTHIRMTEDLVGKQTKLQIKTVVVTSEQSLLNIPPSKLILIFVDFNERNIIIEDPKDKEDGIKLKTLKYLNSTGAHVLLIYCWELSSRRLDEGNLFAPKLQNVNKNEELRRLSQNNSFFSIYETFNVKQRQNFALILENVLK